MTCRVNELQENRQRDVTQMREREERKEMRDRKKEKMKNE
jgi:hypothetical protein